MNKEILTRLRDEIAAGKTLISRILTHPDDTRLLTAVISLFDELAGMGRESKVAVTVLKNQFLSVYELRRDDGDRYPVAKALKTMDKAVREFEVALSEVGDNPAAPARQSKDGLPTLISPKAQQVIHKAEQSVLAGLANNRGLYVGQVPVFPMVALRSDALTAKRVPFEDYAGYPLLLKEWVLVIRPDYVMDTMKAAGLLPDDLDGLTPAQQRAYAKQTEETYEDIIDSCTSKYRMVRVSQHVSYWAKARCIWIAPAAHLAALRACAFGGRFAPTQWAVGFAKAH